MTGLECDGVADYAERLFARRSSSSRIVFAIHAGPLAGGICEDG